MTYLSIGLVGHGAVGRLHVEAIARIPGVRVAAVLGRDSVQTRTFAASLGATPFTDINEFAEGLDAAIVASPSSDHAAHASAVLSRGIPALVELPAAPDLVVFDQLLASVRGAASLSATHTARFTGAAEGVTGVLEARTLGRVREVTIRRHVAARMRTWADDPLLHHGQHAVDCLAMWFGPVRAESARWSRDGRTIELQAQVGDGISAHVEIAHEAPLDEQTIRIAGDAATLLTDGFGVLSVERSGSVDVFLDVPADDAYRGAIARQDRAFVDALRSDGEYVDISVARSNLAFVQRARELAVP